MKAFWIDTTNGPMTIRGKMFDLPFGLKGVVHRPLEITMTLDDSWWVVSEYTTGRRISSITSRTKQRAIEVATKDLIRIGEDKTLGVLRTAPKFNKEE